MQRNFSAKVATLGYSVKQMLSLITSSMRLSRHRTTIHLLKSDNVYQSVLDKNTTVTMCSKGHLLLGSYDAYIELFQSLVRDVMEFMDMLIHI